ncbi:MAG: amino acid ABC transporter permease [Dongiaceae bacterium]
MINWDYLASLNFSVLWQYREPLLRGLATTLEAMAVAAPAGMVLGSLLAVVAQSRRRWLRGLVAAYVELWRDTPLLVQLVWFHFALPTLTGVPTSVMVSGLVVLTLNVTAYFTEVVRAGIEAVDPGQHEAAMALGLPPVLRWRKVVLPQALRMVVPPLAGLVISLLKATAILSALTVNELMRVTVQLANYTFQPVELLTAAAVIYILLGMGLGQLFRLLEARLRLPGS